MLKSKEQELEVLKSQEKVKLLLVTLILQMQTLESS